MVYLGILLLLRGTYRLRLGDIRYCVALISVMCALALAFNLIYDHVAGVSVANLMFISKDFPGTPISIIYRICGKLFTPFMWLSQAFLPFLLVFGCDRLIKKIRSTKDS